MMYPLPRLLGAAPIVLLLSGCLTTATIVPTRYFTLAPDVHVESLAPSGKSLGIRPLVGARPYKLEMAYAEEANRLAYFQRAEWAELPPLMVNRALTDALANLNRFSDVGDAANMARPDYILTGELRRFEADYTGGLPRAVVELTAVVRDLVADTALWQGHLTVEVPLEGGAALSPNRNSDESLAAVAQGLSDAVSKLVGQICTEIGAH